MIFSRLLDIVHADQKLYLVFEFLDMDLKRYIDTGNKSLTPITPEIVKVRFSIVIFWSHFTRRVINALLIIVDAFYHSNSEPGNSKLL